MSKQIENPAECEVRAVVPFMNVQNVRPIEIYRQLIAVHGEGVMNESNVRKWCWMFNEGRTNVHDEERSGRPALITEDLKKRTDQYSGKTGVLLLIKFMRNFLKFLVRQISIGRTFCAFKTRITAYDFLDDPRTFHDHHCEILKYILRYSILVTNWKRRFCPE
jgi:hypothetical protein